MLSSFCIGHSLQATPNSGNVMSPFPSPTLLDADTSVQWYCDEGTCVSQTPLLWASQETKLDKHSAAGQGCAPQSPHPKEDALTTKTCT